VGPFGTALQGEVSNNHKLLQSKAAVVNVMVKRRGWTASCVDGETIANEPPMKHRKNYNGIKTGVSIMLREGYRGNLLTVCEVSGVKGA